MQLQPSELHMFWLQILNLPSVGGPQEPQNSQGLLPNLFIQANYHSMGWGFPVLALLLCVCRVRGFVLFLPFNLSHTFNPQPSYKQMNYLYFVLYNLAIILGNNLLLSSRFRFSKDNPSSKVSVMLPICSFLFRRLFLFLAELMIFNQISRPLIIISFGIMNYV